MIDTTKKAISITTAPLSMPKEDAFECATRDRGLIDHICRFADKLREQNIEVFERKDNIIVTENGYFFAWYDEDIRSMEGGIDNPIPFKAKDRRMKVTIKAENGEYVVGDLADIVAMAYCKNPHKYNKVFFRDCNPENCVADNLYWCHNVWFFIVNNLLKINIKVKNAKLL
jgi:hypothetical protein